MSRLTSLAAVAAVLGLSAASAHAHDLTGHVSTSGIDFLEVQLPTYVPTHIEPPELTQTLFTCPGDRPVNLTQYDTNVDLAVNAFDLSVPSDDTLRVDLNISAWADGQAFIENPFLCFGSTTCQDHMSIEGARAVIDFGLSVSPSGDARVTVDSVELLLAPDDIQFSLSGCAIDDIVNWVVDFAKDWFFDFLVQKVEDIAAEQLAPVLQEMIGGFTQFDGTLGFTSYAARIESVDLDNNGLFVGADADLYSDFPADSCIAANDPGEPASQAGTVPNLTSGPDAHLGVAVNLGLMDDALYQVWRDGMMCMTDDHLRELGLDVHLDIVGLLLPGFEAGTEFSLDAKITEPPRVAATNSSDAELTLHVIGVEADVIGTAPDGSTKTIHVETDLAATAVVGLDPDLNALVLDIGGAEMTRLLIEEDIGIDDARIAQLMDDAIIPLLMEEMAQMQITAPIFNFADYYLILRDVHTDVGYAVAKADLFRAPADDTRAPDTSITSSPTGVVNPKTAIVRVSGSDSEVPSELLRYRVTVDGEARDPSYIREFKVGGYGVTKTYQVQVSALDLADNADPSPALTEVTVDGIPPDITIVGDRTRQSDGAVELEWIIGDDLTADADMVSSIIVYRVLDRTDPANVEVVGTGDFAPGQTAATVDLDPGELYRVEIHVEDGAGNDSRASVMVTVLGDGGGCSASSNGGAGSGALLIIIIIGFVAIARRRRTA